MSDRVFIGYSQDSIEHMERVRSLADRLRSDGVDCDIDQYDDSPPEGWIRWMEKKDREAKFVLVVSTEKNKRRSEGTEESGVGLGAKWEGGIMLSNLYHSEKGNTKYIPVIFGFADRANIPRPLQDATYYNIGKEIGYEDLCRRLTGQPRRKKPSLGPIRNFDMEAPKSLPIREVRTTPSMLFASPIDEAL